MASFDQDAVDKAVLILQPQIDELKTRPVKRVVKQVLHYNDGTFDVFVLEQGL